MSFISFTGPRIEVDAIEKEYEALAENEKRCIQNDLYGRSTPIEESDEMVAAKIEELQRELDEIDDVRKEAYNQARRECLEYVSSRSFQLMFLRADCFDAPKAAQRIVNFWQQKVHLFGAERAFRELGMDDLEEDEVTMLQRGVMFPFPRKDKGHRLVLYMNRGLLSKHAPDRDKNVRTLFFANLSALVADEEAQRRGVVIVVLLDQKSFQWQDYDRTLSKRIIRMWTTMIPMRIASIHHVTNSNPMFEKMLPMLWFSMGKDLRQRYRLHNDEVPGENADQLKNYGIDPIGITSDVGGILDPGVTATMWLNQVNARRRPDDERVDT